MDCYQFCQEMLRAWTNAVLVWLKRSDRFQTFSDVELIETGGIVRVKVRR